MTAAVWMCSCGATQSRVCRPRPRRANLPSSNTATASVRQPACQSTANRAQTPIDARRHSSHVSCACSPSAWVQGRDGCCVLRSACLCVVPCQRDASICSVPLVYEGTVVAHTRLQRGASTHSALCVCVKASSARATNSACTACDQRGPGAAVESGTAVVGAGASQSRRHPPSAPSSGARVLFGAPTNCDAQQQP